MKRVLFSAIFVTCLITGFGIGMVGAQTTSLPVILTGDNVNLLSTLAPSEGSNASEAYGGINVLKIDIAKTADGKPISDLRGKAIHYLPTKAAESVIQGDGFAGKKIKITGKLFKNEAAILVEKIETAPIATGSAPTAAAPVQSSAKPEPPDNTKGEILNSIPVPPKSGKQDL